MIQKTNDRVYIVRCYNKSQQFVYSNEDMANRMAAYFTAELPWWRRVLLQQYYYVTTFFVSHSCGVKQQDVLLEQQIRWNTKMEEMKKCDRPLDRDLK